MRFATLVLLLACAGPLRAQTPFPVIPAPDGPVNALAVVGDTLYFGGDFTFVGPRTGPAAGLNPATGAVVHPFPLIQLTSEVSRGVTHIVPDGAGGFYFAGEFASVGGVAAPNLARVLSDGTVDASFTPSPVRTGTGYGRVDVAAAGDGVLVVGGYFTEVSGQPRDEVAAFDLATGALLPFDVTLESAEPGGLAYLADALIRDGTVLVAGGFARVNGVERRGLALLDLATGDVLPFDAGLDGGVGHLVEAGETVYLVGDFEALDGDTSHNGIAEIAYPSRTDATASPTPWRVTLDYAPGFYFETFSVADVTLTSDDLWVAGTFVDCASGPAPQPTCSGSPGGGGLGPNVPIFGSTLVALPRAGGAVRSASTGAVGRTGPYYFGNAVETDGATVWIGHVRQDVNGDPFYTVITAVDAETGGATGFEIRTRENRISGYQPNVEDLLYRDGVLFVVGATLELGARRSPFFGVVDLTTGLVDTAGYRPTARVEALAPSLDGRRLYVLGGGYHEVDLATGVVTPFPVPYEGGGPIRAVAPSGGPPVYAARMNGPLLATADRLYARSPQGPFGRSAVRAIDLATLGPLDDFSAILTPGHVRDLALAGGHLYITGDFISINDQGRRGVGRVDAETGAVDAWDPMGFRYAEVLGAMAAADDRLFLGVSREITFGDVEALGVATFDVPSGAPVAWGGTVDGSSRWVTHLQVVEGVVYVAGTFLRANGQPRRHLAAFDLAGNLLDWPSEPVQGPVGFLVSERHQRVFLYGSGVAGGNQIQAVPLASAAPTAGAPPPGAESTATLRVSPNPLASAATVALDLPAASRVRVEVYDLLGRRVATLHDGALTAGRSAWRLDAGALAPGTYVVRAVGDEVRTTVRISVAR